MPGTTILLAVIFVLLCSADKITDFKIPSKEEMLVIHRVMPKEGTHDCQKRPFGLHRSPSVQEISVRVGANVVVQGVVETETSNFELSVNNTNGTLVELINHAGAGATVSGGGFSLEALSYGVKITTAASESPSFSGYLVRWPRRWPTSAEILLPSKVITPHLELENAPCGYIRDFGLPMRGLLLEGHTGDWHAHEAETTMIKIAGGPALYEVLGSKDGGPGTRAVRETVVSPLVHRLGEVAEVAPGTVHRAMAHRTCSAWKQMYHQGVGTMTVPEAFPEMGAELNQLFPSETEVQDKPQPRREFFQGNSEESGLLKDLTPMYVDSAIGAGDSEVLKRSETVGTVFRTAHSTERHSPTITVLGEYMLTVTDGALELKVRGVIMNTVAGNVTIKLPSSVYSQDPLPVNVTNGWSTVTLPQAETILMHEGCTYTAKGLVEGTTSVTNYLMRDPSKRGYEVVRRE